MKRGIIPLFLFRNYWILGLLALKSLPFTSEVKKPLLFYNGCL